MYKPLRIIAVSYMLTTESFSHGKCHTLLKLKLKKKEKERENVMYIKKKTYKLMEIFQESSL